MKRCAANVTWQPPCMRARANIFARARVCDSAAIPVCLPPGVSPAQSWHFNPCLRDCTQASVCYSLTIAYFLCLHPPPPYSSLLLVSVSLSTILTRYPISHSSPEDSHCACGSHPIGNIIYLDTEHLWPLTPWGLGRTVYTQSRGLIGHRWPQTLMTVLAYEL